MPPRLSSKLAYKHRSCHPNSHGPRRTCHRASHMLFPQANSGLEGPANSALHFVTLDHSGGCTGTPNSKPPPLTIPRLTICLLKGIHSCKIKSSLYLSKNSSWSLEREMTVRLGGGKTTERGGWGWRGVVAAHSAKCCHCER